WVIDGSKAFITQGTVGGTYVVMARTSDPAPGRERSHGISAFVADGSNPGLVRGRPERKLGLTSSDTTPLTFEGMRLPGDALLGREGEAFADVAHVLTGGRIGIGAMGIGLGRAALETALAYAAERRQFGKPIAHHQAIAFKLAGMATELEAARLLVLKAATLRDAGREHTAALETALAYAAERRQFGKPIAHHQAIAFKLAGMATELEAARLLVLKAATLRDAGREHTAAAAMAKLKGSTAGVDACDAAIQV